MAHARSQLPVDLSACAAPLARWKEPINDQDAFAFPPGFVGELAPELRESRVQQGAGQLGSRKAGHPEIFDGDEIVSFDKLGRQLVKKVLPLVRGSSVGASKPQTGLRSIATTAALPREVPMGSGKAPLPLTGEPW